MNVFSCFLEPPRATTPARSVRNSLGTTSSVFRMLVSPMGKTKSAWTGWVITVKSGVLRIRSRYFSHTAFNSMLDGSNSVVFVHFDLDHWPERTPRTPMQYLEEPIRSTPKIARVARDKVNFEGVILIRECGSIVNLEIQGSLIFFNTKKLRCVSAQNLLLIGSA